MSLPKRVQIGKSSLSVTLDMLSRIAMLKMKKEACFISQHLVPEPGSKWRNFWKRFLNDEDGKMEEWNDWIIDNG
jgi:hypothetical protein